MMKRIKNKFSNQPNGQAMAEFALTIPVFLLLIFGVIELSRYFLVYSSIFTATREATRYGSSVGDASLPNYQNCEMIAETAVRMGNFGGVQTGDITIYYESEPGTWVADCDPAVDPEDRYQPVLGDRVVVEIDTDYDSILGVVPDMTISAENGRTIMLGVLKQGSVIVTEDPDDESTPVPTEDTSTPVPTEDTSTPEPTEEPTEEPTITPSSTPVTPVACPSQGLVIKSSQGGANNINYVEFEIDNETTYPYRLVEMDITFWEIKHGNTNRYLQEIKLGGDTVWEHQSGTSYEVNVNLYPENFYINPDLNKTLNFIFTENTTQNIDIAFDLTFVKIDPSCPKTISK
jgi:hypothetical protein